MTSLNQELTEFNELCRVCANKTNILLALNIFEGNGSNRAIYKKINKCLPIKVTMDDKLPKLICEECVYKLDLLNEFQDISSKTEAFLVDLLNRIFESAGQSVQSLMDVSCSQGMNMNQQTLEEQVKDDLSQSSQLTPLDSPLGSSILGDTIELKTDSNDKVESISINGSAYIVTTEPIEGGTFYFCVLCSKTLPDRNAFNAHCANTHWNKCEPCSLLFTSQEAYHIHCTDIHALDKTSSPTTTTPQDISFILSHMEAYRSLPQQSIVPVLAGGHQAGPNGVHQSITPVLAGQTGPNEVGCQRMMPSNDRLSVENLGTSTSNVTIENRMAPSSNTVTVENRETSNLMLENVDSKSNSQHVSMSSLENVKRNSSLEQMSALRNIDGKSNIEEMRRPSLEQMGSSSDQMRTDRTLVNVNSAEYMSANLHDSGSLINLSTTGHSNLSGHSSIPGNNSNSSLTNVSISGHNINTYPIANSNTSGNSNSSQQPSDSPSNPTLVSNTTNLSHSSNNTHVSRNSSNRHETSNMSERFDDKRSLVTDNIDTHALGHENLVSNVTSLQNTNVTPCNLTTHTTLTSSNITIANLDKNTLGHSTNQQPPTLITLTNLNSIPSLPSDNSSNTIQTLTSIPTIHCVSSGSTLITASDRTIYVSQSHCGSESEALTSSDRNNDRTIYVNISEATTLPSDVRGVYVGHCNNQNGAVLSSNGVNCEREDVKDQEGLLDDGEGYVFVYDEDDPEPTYQPAPISKTSDTKSPPKRKTPPRLKCPHCTKTFTSQARYQCHVSDHGAEKPYKCFKCEKKFRSKIGLEEHEAIHTGRYEYECNACGKGFQCKSYLIVHQRVHSTARPYQCGMCTRQFKTKAALRDHENRHLGVKPYTCEICGRGFITKGLCKSHQKIHTGSDNRQFPCPVCNKLFVSKSYLNTHVRIHTGEKPFVCTHCNKGFLTNMDLRIHNTMHTGEKSFVCETCGKAFARRDALRCHMRSHTGERPYRCNICGQSFTQFSPMAIHKRLHTGERPYACDACDKTFVSRSTMVAHRKKHKEGDCKTDNAVVKAEDNTKILE